MCHSAQLSPLFRFSFPRHRRKLFNLSIKNVISSAAKTNCCRRFHSRASLLNCSSAILGSRVRSSGWVWFSGRGFANCSKKSQSLLHLKDGGVISALFPFQEDFERKFGELCESGRQTVYAGFDPTAESLHVGNLAVIVTLIKCLRAGHNIIALVGGATARVGDPSGKNSDREEIAKNTVDQNSKLIAENIGNIFENYQKYFSSSSPSSSTDVPSARVLNNWDWYKSLSCVDLIGGIGRHMRLGTMLMKEGVKSRLASPHGINFAEFSYQLFQAYDWYHLAKNYNCTIQLGGHDQMGNITAGHDLVKKLLGIQVYGMTVALITTEEGSKYGKSAGNAIWLDAKKTSPFDLYQFLVRTPDHQMTQLLNLLTFKSPAEIQNTMNRHLSEPEARAAQKELAALVTTLVHGESGLNLARRASEALYEDNVEALTSLSLAELRGLFTNQSALFRPIPLRPGATTILDMVMNANCFKTEHDARRVIKAGGFWLNHRRVLNPEEQIEREIHLLPNNLSLARVGKRNYYLIHWQIS